MTNRLIIGLTLQLLGLLLVVTSFPTAPAGIIVGAFLFGFGVSAYVPGSKR